MTKRISHAELSDMLKSLRGAVILSLSWTGNDPARYKRDRGRITKTSHYSGMINARYDLKKAKSLGVEVSEVDIAPVSWRQREGKSCVHRHVSKGTRYVEFYPASGTTTFKLDGVPCERGDVADMLKKSGKSDVPNYRLITLENITRAVVNGQEFEVVTEP